MKVLRFALVGSPVSGSLSPRIHRVLLGMSGREGTYVTRDVDEHGVGVAVEELREGLLDGINVTMPHKVFAAGLCDKLGTDGVRSRSVNTLSLQGELVVGHSTDRSAAAGLLATNRFAELSSVLVLGSGGSARAILEATGDRNTYVAARNRSDLEEIGSAFGVETLQWGTAVAGALVINATPLGMGGELLPENVLLAAGGLIDLPYGRDPTPGVTLAQGRGVPWADGYEFLVRQAIDSFNLWTGAHLEFSEVEAMLIESSQGLRGTGRFDL